MKVMSGLRYAEGERIPKGWAIAWFEPHTGDAVLFPIGLHRVVSFGRRLWYRFRAPSQAAFDYINGKRDGYEKGLLDGQAYAIKCLKNRISDWLNSRG